MKMAKKKAAMKGPRNAPSKKRGMKSPTSKPDFSLMPFRSSRARRVVLPIIVFLFVHSLPCFRFRPPSRSFLRSSSASSSSRYRIADEIVPPDRPQVLGRSGDDYDSGDEEETTRAKQADGEEPGKNNRKSEEPTARNRRGSGSRPPPSSRRGTVPLQGKARPTGSTRRSTNGGAEADDELLMVQSRRVGVSGRGSRSWSPRPPSSMDRGPSSTAQAEWRLDRLFDSLGEMIPEEVLGEQEVEGNKEAALTLDQQFGNGALGRWDEEEGRPWADVGDNWTGRDVLLGRDSGGAPTTAVTEVETSNGGMTLRCRDKAFTQHRSTEASPGRDGTTTTTASSKLYMFVWMLAVASSQGLKTTVRKSFRQQVLFARRIICCRRASFRANRSERRGANRSEDMARIVPSDVAGERVSRVVGPDPARAPSRSSWSCDSTTARPSSNSPSQKVLALAELRSFLCGADGTQHDGHDWLPVQKGSASSCCGGASSSALCEDEAPAGRGSTCRAMSIEEVVDCGGESDPDIPDVSGFREWWQTGCGPASAKNGGEELHVKKTNSRAQLRSLLNGNWVQHSCRKPGWLLSDHGGEKTRAVSVFEFLCQKTFSALVWLVEGKTRICIDENGEFAFVLSCSNMFSCRREFWRDESVGRFFCPPHPIVASGGRGPPRGKREVVSAETMGVEGGSRPPPPIPGLLDVDAVHIVVCGEEVEDLAEDDKVEDSRRTSSFGPLSRSQYIELLFLLGLLHHDEEVLGAEDNNLQRFDIEGRSSPAPLPPRTRARTAWDLSDEEVSQRLRPFEWRLSTERCQNYVYGEGRVYWLVSKEHDHGEQMLPGEVGAEPSPPSLVWSSESIHALKWLQVFRRPGAFSCCTMWPATLGPTSSTSGAALARLRSHHQYENPAEKSEFLISYVRAADPQP